MSHDIPLPAAPELSRGEGGGLHSAGMISRPRHVDRKLQSFSKKLRFASSLTLPHAPTALGGPKIALRGGGWHGRPAKEGGGVPEMGFRAGPFVLCKDGCCHQRRRNKNFGPENFFSRKIFPPHMCSQNDQRDMGIILSHVCWGRTPPPPGTAGRAAPAQTPLPARRPRRGRGGLEKWASVPSPPRKASFFPPCQRPWKKKIAILFEDEMPSPTTVNTNVPTPAMKPAPFFTLGQGSRKVEVWGTALDALHDHISSGQRIGPD